jgi:hypothetical protein
LFRQEQFSTLRRTKFPSHFVRIRGSISDKFKDEFMRFGRIAAFCAASVITAAPAVAQTPFDGNWQVTIVTKTGSCEPTASSMLTVADGKISAPGANVSGTIGSGGLVKVSINGAYANGQLSGNAGSGKWNGASAGIPCSGRWEASRQ